MIPGAMRFVSFLLLLVAIASPSFAFAADTVTLTTVTGDVRVRAPGSKDYVRAEAGASLADGARLKTEADARANLKYPDGTTTEVCPSSEVIIRVGGAKADRPNGVVLFLGRVWAKVAKKSGGETSFEVRSANAVAGVRGTDFEVGVGLDGSARVLVSSGEVVVGVEEEKPASVRGGQELETEQTRAGRVSAREGDPDWDRWFSKCAQRMEKKGLEVAKALDGRLNKRKAKVEKLVAEQRALRAKIEKLEAQKARGADVDEELQDNLQKLERVTARLEDMAARLEGAFGLFARWREVAEGGGIPNSKAIAAMAINVEKIAADFADMIEEGTDQSEEGMDDMMDEMQKGKPTSKPKKGSTADELFR